MRLRVTDIQGNIYNGSTFPDTDMDKVAEVTRQVVISSKCLVMETPDGWVILPARSILVAEIE